MLDFFFSKVADYVHLSSAKTKNFRKIEKAFLDASGSWQYSKRLSNSKASITK